MTYFPYGFEEIQYLEGNDPALGNVIDRVGMIRREVIPDLFTALVFNIIGQQISPKAADTVWKRLQEKLGAITPESVAQATPDDIKCCGLSLRKASYIQVIAEMITRGQLNLEEVAVLPDDEFIKKMSALPGIGIWTAEMLLIFSLQRKDVVSFDDLAIRRGMMKVYGLEFLTKEEFNRIRERYSPYGTVASLYLWAAAHEER